MDGLAGMEERLGESRISPQTSSGAGSRVASDGGSSDTSRTLAALDAVVRRMAHMSSGSQCSGPRSNGSSIDHPHSPRDLSPTASEGHQPGMPSLLFAHSNWSSAASIDMSEDTIETVVHVSGGSSPLGLLKRATSTGIPTINRTFSAMRSSPGAAIRRAGSVAAEGSGANRGRLSPEMMKSPRAHSHFLSSSLDRHPSPLHPSPTRAGASPMRRYTLGMLEFDLAPCIEDDATRPSALIEHIDMTLKKGNSKNRLIDVPQYTAPAIKRDPPVPGTRRQNSRVMKVQNALACISAGDLEGITGPSKQERIRQRLESNKNKSQTMDEEAMKLDYIFH